MLELKWETLNPLDSLPSNNYLLFHGLSLRTHQNTQVDVTVDPWTTWGVGVLTLCTVENLCIVHSRPSAFEVPPYPQFSIHRFDQLQIDHLKSSKLILSLHLVPNPLPTPSPWPNHQETKEKEKKGVGILITESITNCILLVIMLHLSLSFLFYTVITPL